MRERVRDDRRAVARPLRVSRRKMSLCLLGVRDRFLGLCNELVELGGDVVERGDGLPFFVVAIARYAGNESSSRRPARLKAGERRVDEERGG